MSTPFDIDVKISAWAGCPALEELYKSRTLVVLVRQKPLDNQLKPLINMVFIFPKGGAEQASWLRTSCG